MQIDLDRFTEEEYRKEIELNNLRIPPKTTAKRTYALKSDELLKNPQTGVFRDFVNHGVYPVRVHVSRFPVDIPFLVRFMTQAQIKDEIANQLQIPKKDIKSEDDEEYTLLSYCYTLIHLFKDKKIYREYTPPLHRILITSNVLTYFAIPTIRKTLRLKKENISYMFHMLPKGIINEEMRETEKRDPDYSPNKKAETLIMELTIRDPYSQRMRDIMKNAKKISFRHEMLNILDKLSDWRKYIVPAIRITLQNGY